MRPLLVRTVAVVLVSGLVLMFIGCGVVVGAVRAGAAPEFDQQLMLSAQHRLLIHNGRQSSCTTIPNLPEPYPFVPACRVFWVYSLTPHGGRVLVWFRLPG